MSTFNFSLNTESAIREYDNQGSYNTLQAMMNRKEQLLSLIHIFTASYIRRKLQGRYDPREAGNLSRIICCEILGQQTVDRCV